MRKFQVLRNTYPKGTIVGELLDDYDSLTKERDALRTQLDKEYEKRRDLLKLHQEDARLWQIERDALRAEVKELDKLVKAQDKILMAYRVGGNPGNAPDHAAEAREALKQMRQFKDL